MEDDAGDLCFGVERSIGNGESARGEIVRERIECTLILRIGRRCVGDENSLMILGAARENGGDERNAEAAALIAEKIGEAGGFVVFVFG